LFDLVAELGEVKHSEPQRVQIDGEPLLFRCSEQRLDDGASLDRATHLPGDACGIDRDGEPKEPAAWRVRLLAEAKVY
jgi:hypothetical protein